MSLVKNQTNALLQALLPWWGVILLTWIIFGLQQDQKMFIELFAMGLLYTNTGAKIVAFTGLALMAVCGWFIYDSLSSQIETQIGYQIATSDKTVKTVRNQVYKLVQKRILDNVELTPEEEQRIRDEIKRIDTLTKRAIDIVYRNTAIALASMVFVLGFVMLLSYRVPYLRGGFYYYFSLVLTMGVSLVVDMVARKISEKSVPDLSLYMDMYEAFKIWQARFDTRKTTV